MRVSFEPIGKEHADELQRLVENDEEILRYTRMPAPYPPDGARKFIERVTSANECAWMMRGETGELVGVCGLMLHGEEVEIGYSIGAAHRGRGLATTAARELVRRASEELGFRRVKAESLASNVASRRVLEKAGFELIGIRPNGDKEPKWPAEEPMADYRLEIDRLSSDSASDEV